MVIFRPVRRNSHACTDWRRDIKSNPLRQDATQLTRMHRLEADFKCQYSICSTDATHTHAQIGGLTTLTATSVSQEADNIQKS